MKQYYVFNPFIGSGSSGGLYVPAPYPGPDTQLQQYEFSPPHVSIRSFFYRFFPRRNKGGCKNAFCGHVRKPWTLLG